LPETEQLPELTVKVISPSPRPPDVVRVSVEL
jgi:hypothetical protein